MTQSPHWQIPTTDPCGSCILAQCPKGDKPMCKDLLTKERQKVWLVAGVSAAERSILRQADALRDIIGGATGEYDRRSLELSEPWPRSSDVLTIARTSSGI